MCLKGDAIGDNDAIGIAGAIMPDVRFEHLQWRVTRLLPPLTAFSHKGVDFLGRRLHQRRVVFLGSEVALLTHMGQEISGWLSSFIR